MILYFKYYIYILIILNIFSIKKINSCTYTNNEGAIIDLSGFGTDVLNTFSNAGSYNAYFTFCGNLADGSCKQGNLAGVSSYACQYVNGASANYYLLGATNQPLNVTLTDYGFVSTYKAPESSGGCTNGRTLNIQMTCDNNTDFYSDPALNKEGNNPICIYFVYANSRYACKTCNHLNNCNGHGDCNISSGKCMCNDQFSGVACTDSRIMINNVVPSTIKGGQVIINGYFGTTSSALNVTIGDQECTNITSTKTQITCVIGPGEGTKDVVVNDNGYGYNFTNGFTYQYLVCDPVCNPTHGQCNKYEGVCICDDQTNGTTCSNSLLEIDNVIPTTIRGGQVIINGYFGNTSDLLQVLIGNESCTIITKSNVSIECSIGPGEGTKDIIIIDRDLTLVKNESFTYQLLQCIPECNSIHGKCNGTIGECMCDTQTYGQQCENSKLYLSSVSLITVDGGLVYLYGYFGMISNLFNVTMGKLNCDNIYQYNETVLSCEIGPGLGYQNVIVQDNDLMVYGKNLLKYLKTTFECPNDCSFHGECNNKTGVCTCEDIYTGFDCSSKINTEKPSIPKIDMLTGSSSISNENLNYQLNIISLVEYSIDGSVVKEHPLTDISNIKPTIIEEGDGLKVGMIALFTQYIPEVNCTVEYTIEEVVGGKKKNFEFAGLEFQVDSGSLKTTVKISDYQYENNLNTLQLRIKSQFENQTTATNDCNTQSLQVNTNQLGTDSNFNYLQVSKDSKQVVSRFLSRIISDGRISSTQTTLVSSNNLTNELIIGLNIPHFINYCTLDPDFSLLISQNYKDKCSKSNNYKIIAIAVVIPCVVVAALIVVVAVLYKKHYLRIALFKNSLTDNSKKRRSLHL